MVNKELKKLKRKELLFLVLEKDAEIEKLKIDIDKLKAELEDKNVKIKNSGSIAEASLKLNGVFEAAQKAADQYIENIISADLTASETESAAKVRAEVLIKEAELKCENMVAETLKACMKLQKAAENKEALKACLEEFDADDTGIIWN